eukprot:scaffold1267_cov171-Amphora_coffeaeformis.AAC.14
MEMPTAISNVLDSVLEVVYGLQPLVEPTVLLVPSFVETYVQQLSDAIGFDVETLNYTLGLFLCYPLGMIMNLIPYGTMRHVFSFLLGAFLLQFTLGVQWIHQMITCVVAYGMFMVLPRKTCTMAVPVFVMAYCVLGHLHRQYINYLGWDLDFTGAQMVLTQKLYMLAYNLYDGECLAKGKDNRASKKCAAFALKEMPSFIEFLGYNFCFASVLSGPAFEYSTYCAACDGSLMYGKDGKPKGKIPSNVWPTLRPFLISLLNLVVFVGLGANFPLLDPADPQKATPVILTAEFLSKNVVYRYLYMWVGLLCVRQKYYFAWMNAEGANNVWYAGFEGFDDKGNALGWENSSNVDIWAFETAPNLQSLTKEWNKKTSLWLTKYVYIRTNGSLAAVYSMSAFWHGFYPGYYLFFLSVPLLTFCERLAKKKISPYFSSEKWSLYGIAGILTTSLFAEYMVAAFVILALDRSIAAWKSFYFFGHIFPIVAYPILTMLPSAGKKEKKA